MNRRKEVFEFENRFGSSVAEFAYKEHGNRNKRDAMEDAQCHLDILNGNPDQGLFAVFDGHMGDSIANHLIM